MDQFRQLQTFVEVASRGSLVAAARAEEVSPALISRRLDALENRLGIKLLQRTTRRLALTAEGEAFLERCQRILAELADAEAQAAQGSARARGPLLVSAPAGFGRAHIAPLLPQFQALHPEVRVTLDLTDRLVDLVAENVDCAIRIGERLDSSLVGVRLAENRRIACASPTYLARYGVPQVPADLVNHNCLTLGAGSAQQRGWTFRVDGKRQLVRVTGDLVCNDGSVLHEWCLKGHGIAWRSSWEVLDDLQSGRLVAVLEGFRADSSAIQLVFPQRRHLPLRLRVLIEFLRQALSGLDRAPRPAKPPRRAQPSSIR